jgi:hypothetical protein
MPADRTSEHRDQFQRECVLKIFGAEVYPASVVARTSARDHCLGIVISDLGGQIATRTFAVHDNRLTSKPVKLIGF